MYSKIRIVPQLIFKTLNHSGKDYDRPSGTIIAPFDTSFACWDSWRVMLGSNGVLCDVYATQTPLENLPFFAIKMKRRGFHVEVEMKLMKLNEFSLFFCVFWRNETTQHHASTDSLMILQCAEIEYRLSWKEALRDYYPLPIFHFDTFRSILQPHRRFIGEQRFFLRINKVKLRLNTTSYRRAHSWSSEINSYPYRQKIIHNLLFLRWGSFSAYLHYQHTDSMNKLATLAQIKTYKPKQLSSATHAALRGTLKHFLPDPTITALTYTYSFPAHSLPFLHEKMTRIGTIADEIDHHPEWTLREGELQVRLSTHDIGNKVSLKDYVLAGWIEKVLHGEELEAVLLREWNGNELNLQELE